MSNPAKPNFVDALKDLILAYCPGEIVDPNMGDLEKQVAMTTVPKAKEAILEQIRDTKAELLARNTKDRLTALRELEAQVPAAFIALGRPTRKAPVKTVAAPKVEPAGEPAAPQADSSEVGAAAGAADGAVGAELPIG